MQDYPGGNRVASPISEIPIAFCPKSTYRFFEAGCHSLFSAQIGMMARRADGRCPAGKGVALMQEQRGLYDPRADRDECGIGFVASVKGEKSHDILVKGIQILVNLQHRGASGSDPITGDGAGALIQIPHEFFERECARLGFTLPLPGEYGVGMVFLPVERNQRLLCEGILERIVREEGLDRIKQ